jgi:hypothetical protein
MPEEIARTNRLEQGMRDHLNTCLRLIYKHEKPQGLVDLHGLHEDLKRFDEEEDRKAMEERLNNLRASPAKIDDLMADPLLRNSKALQKRRSEIERDLDSL